PLYPSAVLPDGDINTQMVLLEAARIFDERNRDGAVPEPHHGGSYEEGDSTHPALLDTGPVPHPGVAVAEPEPEAVAPAHAAERLRLQIVSGDVPFGESLA